MSSTWIDTYVGALRRLGHMVPIELQIGIEAKLLNEHGDVDAPVDIRGIDRLYVADHQVPLGQNFHAPRAVRRAIAEGDLPASRVVEAIVNATVGAIEQYDNVTVAHMFSVLPKIGLREGDVSDAQVFRIADAAVERGAIIEISERWKCPSLRVVGLLQQRGVQLECSTDAHASEDIGNYNYVANLVASLTSQQCVA